MSISRYKRKQSELCRRLARLAPDGEVRARLRQMANEYMAEAARAEAAEEKFPSIGADPLIGARVSISPRILAYD